jgi:hypothetical protein
MSVKWERLFEVGVSRRGGERRMNRIEVLCIYA